MEKQLFDWVQYDELTNNTIIFYDCKLKVPIGDFKIDDFVSSICINYEEGILMLYDVTGEEISKHKLLLKIK